ncbi:MAG: DNA-processing protein DprA, partial [Rickettsiales bacterium]
MIPDLFHAEYPNLASESHVDVLRLIRSENIGPVTFFKLVSHFGSVSKALEQAADMSMRGGRKKPIKIASKSDAERELEQAGKHGATLLVYGDAYYPKMLQTIHDPPPLLMVMGNPALLNRSMNIGVVGARNASANACRFTSKLAQDLGKENVTVVSGLARGIDGSAHQGALSSGTVGVIAGGIDTVYPPEHKDLYAKMREEGVILSEQPFGSVPQPRNFPARNRIISGMSHGIVVVEASLKSGSLITARMATDQNREVFAVPGSPLDPRCKGTNQLLREGCALVESADDVLSHLNALSGPSLHEAPPQAYHPPAAVQPSENEVEQARDQVIEKLGPEP